MSNWISRSLQPSRRPPKPRPAAAIGGARDELFVADCFAPLLQELNPRIAASVQLDLGHLDMIADPRGTAAVAGAWRRLTSLDTARR